MKKPILINFSVLFVMLLVFVGYWYHELFGQRIVHKFEVTDFSKLKFDTLRPNKKDNYTTHYVKIKGEISDTIKIHLFGYPEIINGKVDTIFKNIDYYGTYDAILKIEPKKYTSGKLFFEHVIQ